ncbi:hypothetical protein BU14_0352s0008 [Porphyra umbilicalis]|uniref:Cobalamin adenosyltransferase-like domain-containing protein n=1 Tax=Porphyra umbilicalis TaxID=2786 RepID=A0A1X6NXL1_PORUM|nr:hypothetical protein BU14_0352s0008 [Porphyra umbilicalis]|eukprot:OSX73389.1 hypothetical protein BU14_0352s0008 [Porphyra umbilicalis]
MHTPAREDFPPFPSFRFDPPQAPRPLPCSFLYPTSALCARRPPTHPPISDAAAAPTTQFPWAPAATTALEGWMDAHTAALSSLTAFILPGGISAATAIHAARTVARHAGWEATDLVRVGGMRWDVYACLNRLSDYLCVAARVAIAAVKEGNCFWNMAALPAAL